eukprot:m.340675 g.340675  ORF g.340675 m.340675 type:complete len:144 (-) comp19453_c0_seq1:251-682(-)
MANIPPPAKSCSHLNALRTGTNALPQGQMRTSLEQGTVLGDLGRHHKQGHEKPQPAISNPSLGALKLGTQALPNGTMQQSISQGTTMGDLGGFYKGHTPTNSTPSSPSRKKCIPGRPPVMPGCDPSLGMDFSQGTTLGDLGKH